MASKSNTEYYYAPFTTEPYKQHHDLAAAYHQIGEPPRDVPAEAVRIVASVLLANPSLAAFKKEIEEKLKAGTILAKQMWKKSGTKTNSTIASYGLGICGSSLPKIFEKSSDWEIISKDQYNKGGGF